MFSNKNHVIAVIVSTSAVALLSVGGYLLHKRIKKRRLESFAQQKAIFDEMYDEDGFFDDYDNEDYDNEDYDDDEDYIKQLLGEMEQEGNEV